jgi:hypothetical protein
MEVKLLGIGRPTEITSIDEDADLEELDPDACDTRVN